MHRSSQSVRDKADVARSARGRYLFLLGALLLIAGAAGLRMTLKSQPAPGNDPLHGNANDAGKALTDLLAKTPPGQRLPLLLRCVQDPSPGLRYAAVDALGEVPSAAATGAIENAFADSSAQVRERALEVLLQVAPERGRRLLAAALRDEDAAIREDAALQWLQQAQRFPETARPAAPALIAALDDTDPIVPLFVSDALCKLSGKPWRIKKMMPPNKRQAVIRDWQAWWKQAAPGWKGAGEFAAIAPIRPDRADPTPALDLVDLDGKPIDLKAQRGRVTLLNFWGTWCGPCQMEIPDLVRLDAAYRGRRVDLIGVAISETDGAQGLRRWCAAHGVRYRQALGSDAVQDTYQLEGVPVSVLIDQKGRIRYRWEGPRDFATFRKAIDRLLTEGAG